jgi:hypothetical protein
MGHFLLAQFLSKDSGRRAEALMEAQAALAMPETADGPPRLVIEQLVAHLTAGAAPPRGTSAFPNSNGFRL